jgi:hypothetical protein
MPMPVPLKYSENLTAQKQVLCQDARKEGIDSDFLSVIG